MSQGPYILPEKAQDLLNAARKNKETSAAYNPISYRRTLTEASKRHTGKTPREWQLDVAEALYLGLDCIVVTGTGTGKTLPFILSNLVSEKTITLIISPLDALESTQVSVSFDLKRETISRLTYKRQRPLMIWGYLQLSSMDRRGALDLVVCVQNSESYSPPAVLTFSIPKDLNAQKFQVILTSPEMLYHNRDFRLTISSCRAQIKKVVIDEAHCVPQWGSKFRLEYGRLDFIRTLVNKSCPVLATSATLPEYYYDEMSTCLRFNLNKTFQINLGNDRPNIRMEIRTIKGKLDDFEDLAHIAAEASTPEGFKHRIIFSNTVEGTLKIVKSLRQHLPEDSQHKWDIAYFHSHRDAETRNQVMEDFGSGKIKILVATEAAGMVCGHFNHHKIMNSHLQKGCDISDIEEIIQYGCPDSLSVWVQRAGRAGRSPNVDATAVLLVEKSIMMTKSAPKSPRKPPKKSV